MREGWKGCGGVTIRAKVERSGGGGGGVEGCTQR